MTPAIKCLILLAVVALLFVTEMIPLAMTAMGASIACCALGLVPEEQIFLGLADSTVVLLVVCSLLALPCFIQVSLKK